MWPVFSIMRWFVFQVKLLPFQKCPFENQSTSEKGDILTDLFVHDQQTRKQTSSYYRTSSSPLNSTYAYSQPLTSHSLLSLLEFSFSPYHSSKYPFMVTTYIQIAKLKECILLLTLLKLTGAFKFMNHFTVLEIGFPFTSSPLSLDEFYTFPFPFPI